MISKQRIWSIVTTAVTIGVIAYLLAHAAGMVSIDVWMGRRVLVPAEEYESFLQFRKLSQLREEIDQKYYSTFDQTELEEGALKGMMAALPDGYSRYFTKEELSRNALSDRGVQIGIGILLSQTEDGRFVIQEVEKNQPAERAGILAGDILLSVDGQRLTVESYATVIGYIKEPKKTHGLFGTYSDIEVEVLRGETVITLTVSREKMEKTSVQLEQWGEIGYIKIDEFISTTDKDFAAAIDQVNRAGAKKLILDLRDNTGGLVDDAVNIAGYLLGKEVIYQTRSQHAEATPHRATQSQQYSGVLVVLVNERTASASELLCAALLEYDRAQIIGVQTFGKGIIQTIYMLPDGSGYKLTTMEYLTPHGNSIHKIGIKPHIIVEGADGQLARAKEVLRERS